MAKYSKNCKDLFHLLTLVKTEKEARDLLEDLLAPNEIDTIALRWAVMREIHKGTPQRETAKKHEISIAKVSRCARVVKHGCGAVSMFIKRLGSK